MSERSGKSLPNFISIRTVSSGLGWTLGSSIPVSLASSASPGPACRRPFLGTLRPQAPAMGPAGRHRGQRRRATLLREPPQGERAGGKMRRLATRGAARRGSCWVALVLRALIHALGLPVCQQVCLCTPSNLTPLPTRDRENVSVQGLPEIFGPSPSFPLSVQDTQADYQPHCTP